ncbi:MAG: hypothetical protein U0800_24310 [Isosphaeraceae bacterium]
MNDREPAAEDRPSRWAIAASVLLPLAGLLLWLWPIGLGGAMPAGGDSMRFSIGLMGFLSESIAAGHLPIWNDRWGWGFPGIAESQMGVYYPPNLVLYGLLPLEWAFTMGLVLHALWAGLGARWAARQFGAGLPGAALAGFVWPASGFYLIHLPHHWAYATGSWMPWIWGLGWAVLRGGGGRRLGWLLASALAIQVLPGHFQLAFITQVGLVVMALASGPRRSWFVVAAALLGSGLLASAQLIPTWRLARLAESDRTWEYLGLFAVMPLHLSCYVAPVLFHGSPLWRPVAWDPFFTSPEEVMGYVGLAPLLMALGAIRVGFRGEPAVRVLAILAFSSLVLSFGPYLPGFSWLVRLPGFSFFRAPARWLLATDLALAILAARGLDLVLSWKRPARALLFFGIFAAIVPLAAIASLELILRDAPAGPGRATATREAADWLLRRSPWTEVTTSAKLREGAHQIQGDLLKRADLLRQGRYSIPPNGLKWADERFRIYRSELEETGFLIAGLVVAAALARWKRTARLLPLILALLAVSDLLMLSRHRKLDTVPLQSMAKASPVLARLASMPRGSRSIDPMGNLSMAAGATNLVAYRTLDLPHPTLLQSQPLADEAFLSEQSRGTGGDVRLLYLNEAAPYLRESLRLGPEYVSGAGRIEVVDDPSLAGWLWGVDWAATEAQPHPVRALVSRGTGPPRAWLFPGDQPAWDQDEPAPVFERPGTGHPLDDGVARPRTSKPGRSKGRAGSSRASSTSLPGRRPGKLRGGRRPATSNRRPAAGWRSAAESEPGQLDLCDWSTGRPTWGSA